MRPHSLLVVVLALWSCDSAGDGGGVEWVQMPHTVSLGAEEALVIPTGEVLDSPDPSVTDVILYKSATVKVSGGCPDSPAHCQPIHICRPSPQSLPTTFSSLDEVCSDAPSDDEQSTIPNAESGMGFTVRLNTADGFARAWVKDIQGSGAGAVVTLEYTVVSAP